MNPRSTGRVVAIFLTLLVWALLPASGSAAPPVPDLGPLPMSFEPNLGQADPGVKFLARGRGYGLFLTPTESVLVLAPPAHPPAGRGAAPGIEPVVVRMRLVGADANATLTGLEPLPGRSHYLLGPAERWRRAVPAFARVRYTDVYPGVSLVFYGTGRELEYDLVVAPGADPGRIVLAFEGAGSLRVDDAGDLVLAVAGGELRLRRPLVYQETEGGRRTLDAGYVLDGERVRFRVAAWDASRPLVIDPVLGYSTLLGGSSNDVGLGIAVDPQGNAYVTGSTISSNFPVSPLPVQGQRAGVTDAFVAKLSPSGVLLYSTFLGGSGDDIGNAIAVDAAGNAYVGGTTNSLNFPVFPVLGAFQTTLRGGPDGFVAKLDPGGSTLAYSTYLGSNTDDTVLGLALDAAGNAYVTGSTASGNFPNNAAVPCRGTKRTGADAFVVRIGATGAAVTYCRFIGGAGIDEGQAISVAPAGTVWVVGTTTSSDLPVRLAVQPTLGGRTDAFVARLAPDVLPVDGDLLSLTYLGGADNDLALAVDTDAAGNAYVTGSTRSVDFPILAARQPVLAGGSDAFVTVFSAAGIVPTFSTYLGGIDDDVGTGIGVHPGDGSIWVGGSTESLDFPVVSPIQAGLIGRRDAFVVRLDATGSTLISATFLGGTGDDAAQALAVDTDGLAYVTGFTNSPTFPTSPIRPLAGLMDAFVTQIAEAGFVQFAQATYQASETGGSALITVRRSGDTSATTTVQFATADGTATAGTDYTATAGTLTFTQGQNVATFTVPVLADAICDGDETVLLNLSNPGAGTALGARSRAVLTILDPTACVNFRAPTFLVRENRGEAQVIVNRSGNGVGSVTVRFSTANGTATAPADYTAVNRTLTFAPGVRNMTVSIPVVNDAVVEGVETVNLALSSVQGATLGVRTAATLEILDQDVGGVIQFSSAVYTVAEGGGRARITVIRSGSTAAGATVQFATSDGTATAGTDYTAVTGTLTFGAGQTVRTFTVPISPDALAEGVETVQLTLSSPGPTTTTALGTRRTALLRIVDASLTLAFARATYSVRETATDVAIPVQLTGINRTPVTVRWTASSGTALAGSDFGIRGSASPLTGVLTFPPGGSPTTVRRATFRLPILTDMRIEGNESVSLALTNAVGAPLVAGRDTATLTILDDDRGGAIQFSAATYTVAENAGMATITVTRGGSTGGGATVEYTASDGSATVGQDYTATSGTLTFGAGETVKRFTVPIIGDADAEGVETVILTLSNPGPNTTTTLGARASAVLRIVDDD